MNSFFRYLFSLTFFLWTSCYLMAQVYTLDSCVSMALRSNKEIQAAQHQTNKYQHTKQALRANYYPKISLFAADMYSTVNSSSTVNVSTPIGQFSGQRLHEALPYFVTETVKERLSHQIADRLSDLNPEIEFQANNMFFASLMVEQPIYMGGKITAGARMGEIGEKMSMLGEQLSREEIIVSVYEAYQLLVKAKEMKVVAEKYDSLLVQLTNEVASAIKHGMASHNDEMKVMVKKNDAELKVRQADNGIRLAQMNLCQLVGLPLNTPIQIATESESDLESVELKDIELENRTEYMLLELKTQLAEQKLKLEVADYRPQIGMMVQTGVMDGMELVGEKLFSFQPFINIGAVLRMPIFHAGEGSHKINAAKAELAQERMNQENLNEKMNLEIQQLSNYVDEAILELNMRQRNVEQCEENLRISKKAYSVGMESLSELLTAQLLWQQAYAEMVESKFQLKNKMMKWRKAAGKIYQSSLFQAQ